MNRRDLLAGGSVWLGGRAPFGQAGFGQWERAAMQRPFLATTIRQFGAAGDGVLDDSQSLQEAIDAASAAGGGTVDVEPGRYLVGNVEMRPNVHIIGSGEGAVLRQREDAQYLLSANSPDEAGASGRLRNIGIRNLRLEGGVESTGFAEHQHILNLNGVANVLIERVTLSGFRGDGIYLGSGNVAGMERHNESVVIRSCFFDGANRDNRNAVSVIDGSGIHIENNTIVRCSREDMPGAIDVEPNRFRFHVIDGIAIVNNRVAQIGGGVAAIAVVAPQPQNVFARPMRNITIAGNVIDAVPSSGILLRQSQNADVATSIGGVRVRDNSIRGAATAMSVSGIRSVQIDGNTFEDCRDGLVIGAPETVGKCADVWIRSNVFRRVGHDSRVARDGFGVGIYGGTRFWITDNMFEDCGRHAKPVGVKFLMGAERPQTENIWIQRNCFVQGASFERPMAAIDIDSGHAVRVGDVFSENAMIPRMP